ncbi:MAG: hypothetical protein K9M45_01545 [Kiritimatiellales bacterium]|nr:hypothetical protein [Kiritimatiellales bacterium]
MRWTKDGRGCNVKRMSISDGKKYAQVLVKKDDYEKLEDHAKSCGFPSFSSWAGAVLLRELKEPKHIQP